MTYSLIWTVLGAALVVFALYDFYSTTMTLDGGGPLSRHFSRLLWKGALGLHSMTGGRRILSGAGPSILLLLILVWFGLCWLGWLMIFSGAEAAVVNATTLVPASVAERAYFAGYTLTTVGYGDFKASGTPALIASVICGFNGLFLVTLAITYSMPVLSASAERRTLAILIHSFGGSTKELLEKGYGDGDFGFMATQLQQLNQGIASVSQKHLAYPLLHYFHDKSEVSSLPLNLTRLREAITIILYAFPDVAFSTRAQLENSQKVIDNFLNNLIGVFPEKNPPIPQAPDTAIFNVLKKSESSPEELRDFMNAQEERKYLLGYVRSGGWRWSDVHEKR